MQALFRKKARYLALFSLVFLSQCCCCIIPLGWQVQQQAPVVQELARVIEQVTLDIQAVTGGRSFISYR